MFALTKYETFYGNMFPGQFVKYKACVDFFNFNVIQVYLTKFSESELERIKMIA